MCNYLSLCQSSHEVGPFLQSYHISSNCHCIYLAPATHLYVRTLLHASDTTSLVPRLSTIRSGNVCENPGYEAKIQLQTYYTPIFNSFSLSLFLPLLPSPSLPTHPQQPPQQFVNFPYALLKTIIMTIGEFETDPIFFSTPSVVEYPLVTYILWVIFLIIMPILLQNMLVRTWAHRNTPTAGEHERQRQQRSVHLPLRARNICCRIPEYNN